MTRPTLSVILITKNEAELVGQCLESVKWADEIIVVDSGSTDATVEICRRYTDKVLVTDWPGFGPQKNRALSMATGDWVLSIDADEEVTPALAREIQVVLLSPQHHVYKIPRLSTLLGRPMRHGDWWPDQVPRLFCRGHASFTNDPVHERLEFTGTAQALKQLLHHDSIRSLEQMIGKINQYTSGGAERLLARGRHGSLRQAVFHGVWAVFRAYVLKRGFLDGREGFIAAVSAGESAYYKYLKCLYHQ
jgi:glycosyltransferase involved in cell wall biosynthesis